ncbi:MAG TPA: proton-conducting transporter membrane subunit [Solirubrobacteraceae bacterium]|nr:proton-conducting transporter membrane subunit [Solirubrobacteraceae bacterium]
MPLLAAALLALLHHLLPRLLIEVLALAAALFTAVATLLLLIHVSGGLSVYWFGGWHPQGQVAIGIDFAVTSLGAGLATFVSLLMVLALVYSARVLDVRTPHYQVLMLTFMAGMVGFCLTGDLFNMFVFFELMSVSAVALVAYKVGQQAALEGGLNFAVINTIGAFLFLLGIGLIYAHTGALNLAQIGRVLAHSPNDRVIVVAFVLLLAAFLVKAAVVPFHFWLDDAYAVALTPVCLLLAGAMSEMGLYGLARIWFGVFGPAFSDQHEAVRAILVGAGLLTALWGGAMSLSEDHLKRMLAFLTISFVGIFLTGVGLLSDEGLAGTAVYVLADGFSKACLFACVGIVQHRLGQVGQRRLQGRGRQLRATAFLFLAAGVLGASLPPFGPFLGKSMIEDAAIKAGYGFVPPLIVLATALAEGAVLRAGARVFLGWGDVEEEREESFSDEDTARETLRPWTTTPAVMFVPTVLLLLGTVGIGVWFGFGDLAATAAHRFADGAGYRAAIFGGPPPLGVAHSSAPAWYDWLYGAASVVLAMIVAGLGLWGRRLRAWMVLTGASAVMRPVKAVHTGKIGDYTAALALGVGVLGALFTITLG